MSNQPMTITLGPKLGNRVVLFDIAELPQASVNKALHYGLTRLVNDYVAGMSADKGDTQEDILLAAQEQIDRIRSGNWSVTGGRTADPVLRQAKELAAIAVKAQADANRAVFVAAATKAGHDWANAQSRTKFMAAVAAKYLDANRDRLMAEAKAMVDQKKAATTTFDLAELMAG